VSEVANASKPAKKVNIWDAILGADHFGDNPEVFCGFGDEQSLPNTCLLQ